MNKVKHTLLSVTLISLFTTLTSCNGQNNTSKSVDNKLLQKSKTDTLKYSGIDVIFQDSKNNFWFGIHNEGLSKFDGKTFAYFTINDGLLDNQIRSIQEDKNGKILISTAKGLSSYDGQNFVNYPTNWDNPIAEWNETKGDVWMYAGEEGGINRFDGKNLNYLILPKPKNQDPYNTYGVTDISKAKDGKIWIATYAAFFYYDGKTVTIFENENLHLKQNELLHIRSVQADSKGRIWIGNNGIGVLLIEGETTINFSEKHHLIHPTSSRNGNKSQPGTLEHVFAIEEDSEGNIWFGDRDTGAWKYDGTTMTNYSIDKNLKSQMVKTIYKDNSNRLLFGMTDGGVYVFNGKSFEKLF